MPQGVRTVVRGPRDSEDGVREEQEFAYLPDAIAHLRATAATLPLNPTGNAALQEFLGPGGVERVAYFLHRDHALHLAVEMNGRHHLITIQPAKAQPLSTHRNARNLP
ncbi:hypothetical protein [Kitasatospora camelliae]|uniref:Uncharacterized protein n=1 Tax=Kitasatospora camelliae TaxID=3156397 RepID=A0AAU8K3V4_9ACTN